MKTLDRLYKNKQSGTSKIRFHVSKEKGRYFDIFSETPFTECHAQNMITDKNGIIATVNFSQLSCLYSKLWNGIHSKHYPVNYEIIE